MSVIFDIDESRLVDEYAEPPWPSDDTLVRLRVADVDVLKWRSARDSQWVVWIPVTLHYFARSGVYAVRQTIDFGRSAIDVTGSGFSLMFLKDGKDILLHQPGAEVTVAVKGTDLLKAWNGIAADTRSLIKVRCPAFLEERELIKHADLANDANGWIEWINGNEDTIRDWSFNWNWRTDHEACLQRVDVTDP